MAKPATDARLAAAARGFTQVIGRGNAHIITKNPTTGKCAYDGQVGGSWHYGAGLETDTAWQPGVAPWNYQMTKALYNVYALSKFSSGQIIKWVDPTSGQYVAFQPMALQWTNALNQIQQISMPQSVEAQVSDDVLYWPSGYGSGRHFKYVASPSRLNKLLIIDSAASLPTTSYDTLELNFIMGMSAGVTPYIDSGSGLAAWDKKTQKDAVKAIEFRLSNGTVVWSFAVPTAHDSSGLPEGATTGTMRLKKQGSSLYVSVRFPKSWIDQAVFPIVIDPTVDYQVGASADDGIWYDNGGTWYYANNGPGLYFGSTPNGYKEYAFARWPSVTIPNGATIDVATIGMYSTANLGTMNGSNIYLEDAANPGAVTSATNGNGRTVTTAYVAVAQYAADNWYDHNVKAIVEELMASYSYASAAAMQMIVKWGAETANNYQYVRSYNYTGNAHGPKLHIEYTEAAGGNPFYAYAQQQ